MFKRATKTGQGDELLQREVAGQENVVAYLTAARADGVTDDDIRQWWNLPPKRREAIEDEDERARIALMIHETQEHGLDADAAAVVMWKHHPRYGDPNNESKASGPDRPLPIELKDRINRWIARVGMTDPETFRQRLLASTSFNAVVREELARGAL